MQTKMIERINLYTAVPKSINYGRFWDLIIVCYDTVKYLKLCVRNKTPGMRLHNVLCYVICNLYFERLSYWLRYYISYSILFYAILFCSILFCSVLFCVRSKPVSVHINLLRRGNIFTWKCQLLTWTECSVNSNKYCPFYGLILTASSTSTLSSAVGKVSVFITCNKQGIKTTTSIFRILVQLKLNDTNLYTIHDSFTTDNFQTLWFQNKYSPVCGIKHSTLHYPDGNNWNLYLWI
jgi:hypothetical protein